MSYFEVKGICPPSLPRFRRSKLEPSDERVAEVGAEVRDLVAVREQLLGAVHLAAAARMTPSTRHWGRGCRLPGSGFGVSPAAAVFERPLRK